MQPMYFELFELLQRFIYGSDTVLTADMELVLTLLSTAGALFVVSLPFLLVWKVVRSF